MIFVFNGLLFRRYFCTLENVLYSWYLGTHVDNEFYMHVYCIGYISGTRLEWMKKPPEIDMWGTN